MDEINIGGKILQYRKMKNLSIRDLAKLTDVTPSLLSQIERGLANPSLNTLKTIAKALEVPLFTFFVTPVNTKELVIRSDKRKKMMLPDSESVVYELLSPDLSGSIEFALMRLVPLSHSSKELMEHEGEEAAFVLEGKIKLYLGDDIIILNMGDSVRIPRGTKHKWENPYDTNTSIVFAVTPPSF
ncbi:helix-turn-helix domain-containing protein [Clostridium thailandense]|uniref:helix-turn-helix domain-containing protein n=1 Tax=Clostridium thailandense TaxID=2794346 RepID=UPI00398900B5